MVVTPDESSWARLSRRTAILDGHRIVYRMAGNGPVLLLVHGMAGSAETWKHVIPLLTGSFTVLAPDLLGQGESDTPEGEYTLEVHARTLRDLMDSLGFESATVVGQSLGGGVALWLAYRFPERCQRLVLVNSGGLGSDLTFYLRVLSLPGLESVFPLLCSPWLLDAAGRVTTWLGATREPAGPAGQEIWRSYVSLADAGRRRAFFRSLREVVNFEGQAVSALDRLHHAESLPTLIVWGAEDPFIPVSHAMVAHQALPGSRLEIFDGVGHYPHCEDPERFVAVLLDFIATTEPARLPPAGQRSVPT